MTRAKTKLFIIGGGGHSRVVIESFRKSGSQIDGIVDPAYIKCENVVGIPVIGGDEALDTFSIDAIRLINGVGVLPGHLGRWKITERLRNRGFKFVTVIDPDAVVSSSLRRGASFGWLHIAGWSNNRQRFSCQHRNYS